MTRGQRLWHLRLWLIVAPVSVLLLVAAIASRPRFPTQPAASGERSVK